MRVNTITESSKYDERRELKNQNESKRRKKDDKDKCISFSEILKRVHSAN
jgi:hypothetical protein